MFPVICTGHLQNLAISINNSLKCFYQKWLIRNAVSMINIGVLQDATSLRSDFTAKA